MPVRLALNPHAQVFTPLYDTDKLAQASQLKKLDAILLNSDSSCCTNNVYCGPEYNLTSPGKLTDSISSSTEHELATSNLTSISPTPTLINPHEPECYTALQELRVKNINRVIFAHININSLRNKVDLLADLVRNKIDVLLITETKLDDSFPESQFLIPGFSTPYRVDRNNTGGGIMLYIREDIPSKQINHYPTCTDIECVFVELSLYKKKWLIGGTYNPCKSMISNHTNKFSKCMNHFLPLYDNFIIMGDFNSEPTENDIKEFCDLYNLKNLVKEPTCFKSLINPTCIDLILTNRCTMFQNTKTIETGLSDFHKMTVTVLKTYFKKSPPKVISYRDYKNFSNVKFRSELLQALSHHNILHISNDAFVEIFMNIFNKHVPLKFKYIRANQGPFMTTELRKAVMNRSKLRNVLNREKTEDANSAYKKQRNLCTNLFRKAKKGYYGQLNPSCVTDNRKFWKTVKPLFSEKKLSNETITIVSNNVIYEDDKIISEMFNNFFKEATKDLNIDKNCDMLNETWEIMDPILNAVGKYSNHPSILKIKEAYRNTDTFSFKHTSYENVYNEIGLINPSKACPKDTIPPNLIKDNCDIFALKMHIDFNESVDCGVFPMNLKLADITPVYKKG